MGRGVFRSKLWSFQIWSFPKGGGYSQPSQNSKCQDLPKFQFSGGGGEGRYSQPSQNSKCQDLPKFQFWGEGGTLSQVKTQSAKICLNFNFRGRGRGEGRGRGRYSQPSQNSKCQDLPKFQFWGGEGGTLSQVKTQSAKIYLNFNFCGEGGGTLSQVKTQSAKICLNFNFRGGGCTLSPVYELSDFWTKIYCAARNLLVHHSSLSYTTYVETNKLIQWIIV